MLKLSNNFKKIIALISLFVVLLMCFPMVLFSTDDTTPVLDVESITISNTYATVGEKIKISFRINNISGEVKYVDAYYYKPIVNTLADKISFKYNVQNGFFESEFEITDTWVNGEYLFKSLMISIGNYSETYYNSENDNVNNNGKIVKLNTLNFTVYGTTGDNTPPSIIPSSLEISNDRGVIGDTIIYKVKILENTAIKNANIKIVNQTGRYEYIYKTLNMEYNPISKLFEANLTIDDSLLKEYWYVYDIYAIDEFNNDFTLYNNRFYSIGTVSSNKGDANLIKATFVNFKEYPDAKLEDNGIVVEKQNVTTGDNLRISLLVGDNFKIDNVKIFYNQELGNNRIILQPQFESFGYRTVGSYQDVEYCSFTTADKYTINEEIGEYGYNSNWIVDKIEVQNMAGHITTFYNKQIYPYSLTDLSAGNFSTYGLKEKNKYSVTFKDYNGTVLKTEEVEEGKSATAPENPIREGYTFIKWDKDFSNITEDLIVTAEYSITTYNVIFKDYDGTVLKTEEVEYGKNATAPKNPVRAGYTFIGWDKEFNNVTEDLEIIAKYNIKKYIVTFKDYDGTLLKTEEVEYGKNAIAPANPVRNGYTFLKWDKDFSNITEDLTIIALYTKNDTTYQVGRKRRKTISVSNILNSTTYYNAVWKIDDTSIAKIQSTSKSSINLGTYYNVVVSANIEGVKNGETYLRLYSLNGIELKTFVISVVNISDSISNCIISDISNQIYTGLQIMPKVTIKNADGIILSENIDYIVEYENNIYPGTATMKINGIDTYTDSITKKFIIESNIENIDITPYMFNSTYYADMNQDLKNAFGYDETKLRNHYLNFGIKEGRQATPIFNAKYYLNKYKDLKNAFGNNYEQAYYHFIANGINEGRAGSKYFDVKFYSNSYNDLRKAFGGNYSRSLEHFAKYGLNEGRIGSNDFNIKDYYDNCSGYVKNKLEKNYIKYYAYVQGANVIVDEPIIISDYLFDVDLYYNLYSDLQKALGYDETALKQHYLNWGIKEGRIASYVFDPKYYLNKYNDLRKSFTSNGYEQAFNHFVNYGINEGRSASIIFDVKYYLKNNKDVENAFGTNYSRALEHFAKYGISEGRIASSEFNVKTYKENYNDLLKAFENNWKQYFRHYMIWGQKENRKCI